ncbi:MAG: hypothetical protein CMK06_11005 [Ponticaulis sp.]|nr:hypothetical protein [Ponticaulis sp.]
MGMSEAVALYFKNYFKFHGRSRRAEYWWPALALMLIQIAANLIAATFSALGDIGSLIGGLVMILFWLFSLATIIPGLAVSFRRLHDTERTAWWLLIAFIPLIGAIVLLIFMALEGTKGSNKYGQDPKGFSSIETF